MNEKRAMKEAVRSAPEDEATSQERVAPDSRSLNPPLQPDGNLHDESRSTRACTGLRRLASRPQALLIGFGTCLVLLLLASPLLWGGYHWYAGQVALKRYHSAEAHRHLQDCLRVWPWSRVARVHLLAARAAWRDGDFVKATRHLEDCQNLEGNASADSILEWSLVHAAGGDLDRAEDALKSRAQRDPSLRTLVAEALIQGYLRTARLNEAIHYADDWMAREPGNLQAHYLRGNIARRMGWSSEAAANYGRVVELDPDRPGAREGLVIALVDSGRYEEAAQHLEALQQHHPLDVEMQVRLAICRYRVGHGREAQTILDGVLAEHPDNGPALLTRGQIAQAAGQLPEAEEWLRRAVRVMPNDHKAHLSLCKCLRQQGKAEADQEQKRADALRSRWERYNELTTHLLSQRPNNPALQCELGKLMLELGLPEAGRNWLLGALRLDEHYTPALTALADYYQQQGDTDAAEEYRLRARLSTRP